MFQRCLISFCFVAAGKQFSVRGPGQTARLRTSQREAVVSEKDDCKTTEVNQRGKLYMDAFYFVTCIAAIFCDVQNFCRTLECQPGPAFLSYCINILSSQVKKTCVL